MDQKRCCVCQNKIITENWEICDYGWICKTCKNKCPEHCAPCPVEMKELELYGEEF
jgi:hypothetical protein